MISKTSIAAACMMIACSVLGIGSFAWAQTRDWSNGDEEGACSNRTIKGDYGFSIEGVILAIPGVMLPPGADLPMRGVAMTHFDGKGNLTQVDHVLVAGMPPAVEWTSGSGTYTINPNCTGVVVIRVPGNPLSPLKLHVVVVKAGKEIHTVVEANAVTSIGLRVE